MELIPIIYNILLLGVIVFVVVIFLSFLFSRIRRNSEEELNNSSINRAPLRQQRINAENASAVNRVYQNPNPVYPETRPVIYPLNQYQSKQIKVVRKQSLPTHVEEERSRKNKTGNSVNVTNGRKPRYVIVNEEMRKYKNHNGTNDGFWKSAL